MRGYKPGDVIGGFEIIEQISSTLTYAGDKGQYKVYCRTCGKCTIMSSPQIRYRRDCGCRQATYKHHKPKYTPWMSEEDIYQHWKSLLDKQEGYTILAQLNAVPVGVIEDIIRRQTARHELQQNIGRTYD